MGREHDSHPEQIAVRNELTRIAAELSKDEKYRNFFGLTADEITSLVDHLIIDHRGSISPMFLSPAFSDDDENEHAACVRTSPFGTPQTALEHESEHGLHYKVCMKAFEDPETCVHAIKQFSETVLGDTDFVSAIQRSGRAHQTGLLERMQVLVKSLDELSLEEQVKVILENAALLGALTYQHAYFVDPALCEAVASFGNHGSIWLVEELNSLVGKYVIPKETIYRGYLNGEYQALFEAASGAQKALLVKRKEYRSLGRERFLKGVPFDPSEIDQEVSDSPEIVDQRRE